MEKKLKDLAIMIAQRNYDYQEDCDFTAPEVLTVLVSELFEKEGESIDQSELYDFIENLIKQP